MTIPIAIMLVILIATKYAYKYAEDRGLVRWKTVALIAYQWTMCALVIVAAQRVLADPTTPAWGGALVVLLTIGFVCLFVYASLLAIGKLVDPDNFQLPSE